MPKTCIILPPKNPPIKEPAALKPKNMGKWFSSCLPYSSFAFLVDRTSKYSQMILINKLEKH